MWKLTLLILSSSLVSSVLKGCRFKPEQKQYSLYNSYYNCLITVPTCIESNWGGLSFAILPYPQLRLTTKTLIQVLPCGPQNLECNFSGKLPVIPPPPFLESHQSNFIVPSPWDLHFCLEVVLNSLII